MNELKYYRIKNLEQYTKYCNIHEQLVIEDNESKQDEIDLLELLIEDYDKRFATAKYQPLNPVELLSSLLEEGNIRQSELAKALSISRQLVSDVLGYRRNISKELVVKLADYFSMSQEAFSREYDLEENRDKIKKAS